MTAGVSPSIVWIELAWFGGDGCSVTRRSVRRRGNRSGVAELVPAGCSLWPPRLLGVGGGLVALVGGAVALVGGAVAVALVGGPVALVGGPVAHVRGPLTGVGDMVTVISGPVAFLGELLSLVGGRSRAARSSWVRSWAAVRRASPVLAACRACSASRARASAARTRASSRALAATRARCTSWMTSWATSASLREDDRARTRSCWTPRPG